MLKSISVECMFYYYSWRFVSVLYEMHKCVHNKNMEYKYRAVINIIFDATCCINKIMATVWTTPFGDLSPFENIYSGPFTRRIKLAVHRIYTIELVFEQNNKYVSCPMQTNIVVFDAINEKLNILLDER